MSYRTSGTRLPAWRWPSRASTMTSFGRSVGPVSRALRSRSRPPRSPPRARRATRQRILVGALRLLLQCACGSRRVPLDRDSDSLIRRNLRPRRVIPRWHNPTVSAARAETHAPAELTAGAVQRASAEGARAGEEWQQHGGSRFAGDLISAALVAGTTEIARDAATALLDAPEASRLAKQVARRLLEPDRSQQRVDVCLADQADFGRIARAVSTLRAELREDPRHALARVELARQ